MLQYMNFFWLVMFSVQKTYSSDQGLWTSFIIICFNIYIDAMPLHMLFLTD